MIKVQNNTATREPIPAFLLGLHVDSLADLSWTDPALGVQDCAWWPEELAAVELAANQVIDGEVLELDAGRRVVVVRQQVRDKTQEELDAEAARAAAEKQARRETITAQIAALQTELEALA